MLAVVFAKIEELAPYAALELVPPEGSLIALALWFYRATEERAGYRQILQCNSISAGGADSLRALKEPPSARSSRGAISGRFRYRPI